LADGQQVAERMPGARQAGPASIPDLALAPVLAVAALLALLLVAFSGRYGYHRCTSWPAAGTWRGATLTSRRWCRSLPG